MDELSQKRFDSLRKLDKANWTEADFGFMKARRSYLSSDEVKVLGLEQVPDTPAVPDEPPKRSKKSE